MHLVGGIAPEWSIHAITLQSIEHRQAQCPGTPGYLPAGLISCKVDGGGTVNPHLAVEAHGRASIKVRQENRKVVIRYLHDASLRIQQSKESERLLPDWTRNARDQPDVSPSQNCQRSRPLHLTRRSEHELEASRHDWDGEGDADGLVENIVSEVLTRFEWGIRSIGFGPYVSVWAITGNWAVRRLPGNRGDFTGLRGGRGGTTGRPFSPFFGGKAAKRRQILRQICSKTAKNRPFSGLRQLRPVPPLLNLPPLCCSLLGTVPSASLPP